MSEPEPLVVVVDDEPGIVDFVELGLRQEGYRVLSAATARAGLIAVRRERPDLVILDVGLPDGDGFGLLTTIRAETDVPEIGRASCRERVYDDV